jgi:hypothetical protein
MDIKYAGTPLTPREAEMSFTLHGSFVDVWDQAVTLPERTLTIRLQPGQSWSKATPRIMRRGQAVDLDINGKRFIGRVRYRRLEKLVVDGRFESQP